MLSTARNCVWFRLHVLPILPVLFQLLQSSPQHCLLFSAIINRHARKTISRRRATYWRPSLALSAAKSDTKRLCDATRHIRAPREALDNKQALLPYTAFSVQTVRHSGYLKSSLWGADWVTYIHFSIQMDNCSSSQHELYCYDLRKERSLLPRRRAGLQTGTSCH